MNSRTQATADKIVRFISIYRMKNGYSPSYREIGAEVGIRSSASVKHYISRLGEMGIIDYEKGCERTVHLVNTRLEPAQNGGYRCSTCGKTVNAEKAAGFRFCPWCGNRIYSYTTRNEGGNGNG